MITIPVRAKRGDDGAVDMAAAEAAIGEVVELIDERARPFLQFVMTSELTGDEAVLVLAGEAPQLPPVRVLLGMPSGSDMKAKTAFDLLGVVLHARGLGMECAPINAAGSNYERNLNNLANTAIANEFDYLMIMDADMRFPPDLIERLVLADKDIVGGTYRARNGQNEVLGFELPIIETCGSQPWGPIDPCDGRFRAVARLPGGCLLIKRHVLEALRGENGKIFRKLGADGSADYAFCDEARLNGFEIWHDPAVSADLRHIGEVELAL